MRRWMAAGLLLGLLLLPLAAAAQTTTAETTETTATAAPKAPTEKVLSVELIDGAGRLVSDVQQYTFWEHPYLSGGGRQQPGTLTVRNNTQHAVTVRLHRIDIPYDNEQALAYLAALQMTVTQDGQPLYQGAYAKANESEALRREYNLQPGEQLEWRIALSCPFSYAGDVQEVSVPCEWEFYAVATTLQTDIPDVQDSLGSEAIKGALIGSGVVLAGCLIAALVHRLRKRKQ